MATRLHMTHLQRQLCSPQLLGHLLYEAQHSRVTRLVVCELAAAGQLYQAAAWLSHRLHRKHQHNNQAVCALSMNNVIGNHAFERYILLITSCFFAQQDCFVQKQELAAQLILLLLPLIRPQVCVKTCQAGAAAQLCATESLVSLQQLNKSSRLS